MALDLVLYGAFAAGFAAGRLTRWRSPWVGRAAAATVGVLLFLLGVSLGRLDLSAVQSEVPLAAAFAVLTLAVTILLVRILAPPAPSSRTSPAPGRANLLPPLVYVLAVVAGVIVGHTANVNPGTTTEYVLYALLALVGFDLTLDPKRLRAAWAPIASAVVGGFAVAAMFVGLGLVPAGASLATAGAFGWYSLAGPLVAGRLGASLGLFAFLANFLRENLTMLAAPWAGPRVSGAGLAAMGGATSMDTTLYFATRYGGEGAGTIALATGIVLTLVAGLVVPVLLLLP
ncbi:MAG: lysine exporter LysO family protein [Thermoplasmata archaeon]|nr:lysine exporter LysO family protein [Thermoplasmata archaeon]